MAGTVGAARGKRGLAAASASFSGGLALGAAVLFGGLGLLGASFDIPRAALLAVVALAVVVDAAALLIAWHRGGTVTVAASETLTPVLQETIPGVEKLAVSTKWLVYRAGYRDGTEQILYRSITDPTKAITITRRRPAGQLGRPVV